MLIKKLMNETVEMFSDELNKEETKNKIIIPIIDTVIEKIRPYVLGMSIFFIIMILLIACILYITIFK